jgi:Tol biopolymer transport system component
VAAPRPHPNGNPSSDLWVINADDGNERRLTTTGDILGRPQWWPGKQVLFTRQSPEGTTIWLKDFEAEKQMTFEGQALHPTYSPDGQRIADVFSPHPAADFSLWVMDVGAFPPIIERYQVDDTNKRKLVDGVQPQPVAWSRDGQRIAFTDAEGRLMTLEVATGAVRILTDPPPFARDVTPAWSPDNCLIAFVRETRAARTLWMVPADRPGEQPLTVGTRFDEDPWFSNERESNLKRSSNFYRLLYVTSPNGKEGDEGDWWLRTMTFVRGQ